MFDENMPPKLARAIIELSKGSNHQILIIREEFGAGTSDVSWMTQSTNKYGPDVVAITCDHHIKSRPHEMASFKNNGLRAFVLPKLFTQYKYWDKSAFLVRWWPKIVETAETSSPGELFLIPGRQTPKDLKAYRSPS
ncbi:MAG: hypothetical protein RIB30_10595 [Thalassospira sp.]|uniref:PIN-like domain-containing protein n=1 Tax=Thalassospira sp. TaxID=1912094 RepID=UPI0032F003E5